MSSANFSITSEKMI